MLVINAMSTLMNCNTVATYITLLQHFKDACTPKTTLTDICTGSWLGNEVLTCGYRVPIIV